MSAMLRWSPEQLAEFERRRAGWEKGGQVTVRTIVCEDDREPDRRQNGQARVPRIAEKYVLKACLDLLANHPRVAFSWRQNSGMAMDRTGNHVRFSPKGTPDILGMLVSGRFLAVECKATGKRASPEQQAFLEAVNAGGGLGICVDDPLKLAEALDK